MLVEINCETDFVARNEQFKQFAKDVAMQIAATSPQYLKSEDVPQDIIEKEKEILKSQAGNKPPNIIEKMITIIIKRSYTIS